MRIILSTLVDYLVDRLLGFLGANVDFPSTMSFLELNMLMKRREKTIDCGMYHWFLFFSFFS
jgi:hypothetical protein